jgi:hypothetical protein
LKESLALGGKKVPQEWRGEGTLVIAKDGVKMKTVIRLLLGILLISCSSSAFAETAQEMLSACRPIAKANLSGSKGKATGPDTFNAGKCWGAFTVIQNAIERVDDRMLLIYNLCPPAESSKTQLIAMFVDYAEKNPQRLQEEFFDVFLDALRKAFPCQPEKGRRGRP